MNKFTYWLIHYSKETIPLANFRNVLIYYYLSFLSVYYYLFYVLCQFYNKMDFLLTVIQIPSYSFP